MLKLLILVISVVSVSSEQSRAAEANIDGARSRVTVRVFKSGLFSALGHDHEIAAPVSGGCLDDESRVVELRIKTAKMTVLDPGASASDRAQIQSTMLSEKVLGVGQYPDIVYRSTQIKPKNGGYLVEGILTLHGQSRPVSLSVSSRDAHYTGTTYVKQTDFGIQPVKVFGGSVSVKDAVEISFDIYPER